jgi:hypothetical protein
MRQFFLNWCIFQDERIADRKGHPKAIGAVARHLAEACFYVLSRNEAYRDPSLKSGQSKGT